MDKKRKLPSQTFYYQVLTSKYEQRLDKSMQNVLEGKNINLYDNVLLPHVKKASKLFNISSDKVKNQDLSDHEKKQLIYYLLFTYKNKFQIQQYIQNIYPDLPKTFYDPSIINSLDKSDSYYSYIKDELGASTEISYKILETTDAFFSAFFKAIPSYIVLLEKDNDYAYIQLNDSQTNLLSISKDFCDERNRTIFFKKLGKAGSFGAISEPQTLEDLRMHPIKAVSVSISKSKKVKFNPMSVVIKSYALPVQESASSYGNIGTTLSIYERILNPCLYDDAKQNMEQCELDKKLFPKPPSCYCDGDINRSYPNSSPNKLYDERMGHSLNTKRLQKLLQQLQSYPYLYLTLKDPFHEGIIGGMTSYLYDGGVCPYVLKYFGTYVCRQNKSFEPYSVMESVPYSLKSLIHRSRFNGEFSFETSFMLEDIMIWISQFCWAFAKLKEYFGINHFDCHLGNVQICYYNSNKDPNKIIIGDQRDNSTLPQKLIYQGHDMSDNLYISHKVSEKEFLVLEDNGVLLKIIDYGLTSSNLDKSSQDNINRNLFIKNEAFDTHYLGNVIAYQALLNSITNDVYFHTVDVNFFLCELWSYFKYGKDMFSSIKSDIDTETISVRGIQNKVSSYLKTSKALDILDTEDLEEFVKTINPDIDKFLDLDPFILPKGMYLVRGKNSTEPYDIMKKLPNEVKQNFNLFEIFSTNNYTFIKNDGMFRIRDVGSETALQDEKIDHNLLLRRILRYAESKNQVIEDDDGNKYYYLLRTFGTTPNEFKTKFIRNPHVLTLDHIITHHNLKFDSLQHIDQAAYQIQSVYVLPISSIILNHYYEMMWKETRKALPLVSHERLVCGSFTPTVDIQNKIQMYDIQIQPEISAYKIYYPDSHSYIELVNIHLVYAKRGGSRLSLVTDKLELWESVGNVGGENFVLLSGVISTTFDNISMISDGQWEKLFSSKDRTLVSNLEKKPYINYPIGFYYSKDLQTNFPIHVDFPTYYRDKLAVILFYDNKIIFEKYNKFQEKYRTYEENVYIHIEPYTDKTFSLITQNNILKINGTPQLLNDEKIDYNYAFVSGPVLVWGGEVVFDKNLFHRETKVGNKNVSFIMNNDNSYAYKMDEFDTDYYGQKQSGVHKQLIMCLTSSDDVLFIFVEGDGFDAPGLDRVVLTKLVLKFDVRDAVLLKGGGDVNGIVSIGGEQKFIMKEVDHGKVGPKILIEIGGDEKFEMKCWK